MEISAQLDDQTIRIAFSDPGGLRGFVGEASRQGAFLVALPSKPSPFVLYTVALTIDDWLDFRFQAPVIQVFDGPQGGCRATFQFDAWPAERWAELDERLAGPRVPIAADEPAVEPALPSEEEPAGEMRGASPIMRIRGMNVSERMRLALKADRTEKNILIRDSSPQVLLALLNNQHLGSDDVQAIAKSTVASVAVLDRIAKERRWTANSAVQRALVQNPKTPVPLALRFIELLPTEDLRKFAKTQSGLKEKLRTAALRAYLKRTQRR